MAKVTVIIPAYNVEKYIDDCILSWANQTLSDIEIIVVDDASTDSTPDILKKWCEKDSRINVLTMDSNKSALTARKVGVATATGKYIMFSDADDTVTEDACELLYSEMEKKPVDILHFNVNIINECGASENDIELLENFLKPYNGKLNGEDVFWGCYSKAKYKWTLWNKIFQAEVCKKAIQSQEDEYILVAEDALAFFYIAYYSKSYRSYNGKGLYNYYYGHGESGGKKVDLKLLLRQCSSSYAVHAMERFALANNLSSQYCDAINIFKKEMINCSVQWFLYSLPDDEKGEGFDILMDHWTQSDVIANIASKKVIDKYRFSKQLINSRTLKYQPRTVKTIASYFHTTGIGGTERVLCSLSKIWIDMGYHVIVITDIRNTEFEFELPQEIEIVVLSDYNNSNFCGYEERVKLLYSIINKYHIDLLVYHDWMKESMLWDEIIIKAAGSAFVAYCHGTFTTDFHVSSRGLSNIVAPFLLSDAVITLSETNKSFWENFNSNVYNVINPFTYNFDDWTKSECDGQEILWLARISPEKRPFDTLKIMKEVLKIVPNAKLNIVGSSIKPEYERRIKKAISKMGLKKNVIFWGAQTDVMIYYQEASIFLMTSEFEGYPLTLQESMLSGLPTVMYDLPYLTLTRDNPSIICVEQENYVAAGAAIADLLLDTNKRKNLGNAARKYIEQFKNYDFNKVWKSIFESVLSNKDFKVSKEQREMMETLVTDHELGLRKTKEATFYAHRKAIKCAIKLIKFKDSVSKR